ncbi:MAG TPA: hypothetical protein VJV05_02885 [Pyrinomonadaceae bacterium]|nr:hypothetical protein [Pyrinomonadaceae bacterium]
MSEPLDQRNLPEKKEPEILVNEYGETRDPAVVVEEADRTVLLTPDETVIIDKEPRYDIVPANRPRKVYSGMWGRPELITAGLAMLALMTAVLLWVFMVIPANRELEHNRAERDRLERELTSAREKYGNITNTETHVATLMTSVNDFESNNLPVMASGRASLYQRINGLIAGYGLINSSGPDYIPLETLDQEDGVKSEEERGRAKYQSLFPGEYVTMTLEGSYQNLRRFIRDIETGRDFVIISSIELEPSDAQQRPSDASQQQQQPQQQPQPAGPRRPAPNQSNFQTFGGPTSQSGAPVDKGKMHGEVVSLRLELAAYFRRQTTVAPMEPVQEQ